MANFADDRVPRIAALDAARGAAIVAMVVYHAGFDLSARQLIAVDVTRNLGWILLARLTAGTFLLIVGISLVLATRRGLDRPRFFRRLGLVVGGAALVSLATWFADARSFVFFGILHQIALASLLALPFLRLPAALVAAVAAAVIALPFFYASPVFDWPPLWWVGLSATEPSSVDYVPVFPWFGVVLAGTLVGRFIVARLLDTPFARWRPGDPFGRAAVWAGRWSLAIYLIHQPLLYGLLWVAAPWLPVNQTAVRNNFNDQCVLSCRERATGADVCESFCGCMYDHLAGTELMKLRSAAMMTPEQRQQWDAILRACLPPAQGGGDEAPAPATPLPPQ
jgi:uncharacterized membrane protein